MKDDPVLMTMLFDFYGDILTERQKEFFDYYHLGDLSLSEIADNEGITRQGVRDVVSRAEDTLREMEEKLGLVNRWLQIRRKINETRAAANAIAEVNARRYANAEIDEQVARIVQILDGWEE